MREMHTGSAPGRVRLTGFGPCANHAAGGAVEPMSDPYTRLDAAERRLDDALARFETALASASGRPHGDGAEEGRLKVECARLATALDEARRKTDELNAMSKDAAHRLDEAIAQIDLLLES
jgi:hypothetical protein